MIFFGTCRFLIIILLFGNVGICENVSCHVWEIVKKNVCDRYIFAVINKKCIFASRRLFESSRGDKLPFQNVIWQVSNSSLSRLSFVPSTGSVRIFYGFSTAFVRVRSVEIRRKTVEHS